MFDDRIQMIEKLLYGRQPAQRYAILGLARIEAVRRLQERTEIPKLVLRGQWREIVRDYVAQLRPGECADPEEVLWRYVTLLLYLCAQNEEVLAVRMDRWALVEWRMLLIDTDRAERMAAWYSIN